MELQYGGSWYFTWTVAPSDMGDKAAKEGGECTAEETESQRSHVHQLIPTGITYTYIPGMCSIMDESGGEGDPASEYAGGGVSMERTKLITIIIIIQTNMC